MLSQTIKTDIISKLLFIKPCIEILGLNSKSWFKSMQMNLNCLASSSHHYQHFKYLLSLHNTRLPVSIIPLPQLLWLIYIVTWSHSLNHFLLLMGSCVQFHCMWCNSFICFWTFSLHFIFYTIRSVILWVYFTFVCITSILYMFHKVILSGSEYTNQYCIGNHHWYLLWPLESSSNNSLKLDWKED